MISWLSRRGDIKSKAPNLIGSIGGSEAEAGKYWMVECEGCFYMVPVLGERIVLVRSLEEGHA